MKKIIYLMGKSASGKDTIYRELLKRFPNLKRLIPFTTRPRREGEQDGEDYHFVTPEELDAFEKSGKLVEKRVYETVAGPWIYATVDWETAPDASSGKEGSSDGSGAAIGIGTLESYLKLRAYYGADRMLPLYIETDDGTRLQRALDREKKQKNPNYAELCRRFLADQQDFSEEKLEEAGIRKRYRNDVLPDCLARIAEDVIHYA
ncbi:MAG: guanylate kinase [Stomatobaculum sp.]|nr:guanylate kinase [Stomatobaculum sp.]